MALPRPWPAPVTTATRPSPLTPPPRSRSRGAEVGDAEVERRHLGAAVALDELAGEVAPGRRGQVERAQPDVLGRADEAERRLRHHLLRELGGRSTPSRAEVAIDPTWIPLTRMRGRAVERHQPGHVRHGALGGAVGHEAPVGPPAHERADVHDRAAALLEHVRDRELRQLERRRDVEVERVLELLRRRLQQGQRGRCRPRC